LKTLKFIQGVSVLCMLLTLWGLLIKWFLSHIYIFNAIEIIDSNLAV